MLEVGTRRRGQPTPPWAVFEALVDPDRDPSRPWLVLLDGEVRPDVLQTDEPHLVVWSSLWQRRLDAQVRFDLPPSAGQGGTGSGERRRPQSSGPTPRSGAVMSPVPGAPPASP